MKCLVKFEADWADEHNVYGFYVYGNDEEIQKQFTYAKAYWEVYPYIDVEFYFGTNECITFEDYESYRRSFDLIDCTEEDYQVLQDKFGNSGGVVEWGWTGAMDFFDCVFGWGDSEEKNPRLLKLAEELWPPQNIQHDPTPEELEDFWDPKPKETFWDVN